MSPSKRFEKLVSINKAKNLTHLSAILTMIRSKNFLKNPEKNGVASLEVFNNDFVDSMRSANRKKK